VFQYLAMGAPLFDPELGVNMLRLVHAEQDMTFHAPVHAGDVIRTTTAVKAIHDRTSGELLELTLRSVNQRDQPVVDTVAGLFIRGRTRRGAAAQEEPAAAPEAPAVRGACVLERNIPVAADQSLRYADASGDHNPIHKEEDVARSAGLPGIILHGMCSMALAHNALVEALCPTRPLGLRRLQMKFAKPVQNGEVLTLKAFALQDDRHLALDIHNGAGVGVVEDARAWLV
jgi:acyl dehydratase